MGPIRDGHQAAVGVLDEAAAHLRTLDPSTSSSRLLSGVGWGALRLAEDEAGLRLGTVTAATLAGLLDYLARRDHISGAAITLAADITRKEAP
jgi:hypothetical protein